MASIKSQSVNAPSNVSETVVRGTDQAVSTTKAKVSSKAENVFGQKILVGGQTLETGFFEGCILAYTNLVYKPHALALIVVSSFYFLNLVVTDKPNKSIFILMADRTVETQKSNELLLIKPLMILIAGAFRFLAKHPDYFAMLFGFWGVYFAKPSDRNAFTSGFLSLLGIFIISYHLELLLLVHLYFLFTQLRKPSHKAFIAVTAVAALIFGHEHIHHITGMADHTPKYGDSASSPGLKAPVKKS